MDENDSSQQQPANKKIKKKCLEFSIDRISALPDDIIITILSFLPLREAASTSVLSPRWSNLWKHTSNLDFVDTTTEIEHDSWDVETCKHVKVVNSVLESHQAINVKHLRISFYVNKSAQSAVAKWLEFVWARQVKRLRLNFHCHSVNHALVLGDSMGGITRPMKYLKSLSLRSMTISGEDISLFLQNCPLLKDLRIATSTLTSDAHVCGPNLALEGFEISGCSLKEKVVRISPPNLSIVVVDAKPGEIWFENVPKLAEASFGIRCRIYRTMQRFASAISCFTSQLQKLTFHVSYHKKLLEEEFPQMPSLKELVVAVREVYEFDCLMPVTRVISACPRLQNFTFMFLAIEKVTPEGKRCPHQHFKVLHFDGSCSRNIIQSLVYISKTDAFHKINSVTRTTLVTKEHRIQLITQLITQLRHQVRLLFQIRLRFQVHILSLNFSLY